MEPVEDYLGEYLSAYIGNSGWTGRVHGVYVTKNKIMVVPFGWKYFAVPYAFLTAGIGFYVAAFYFSRGIPRADSLWFFAALLVAQLIVIVADGSNSLVETKLRHQKPSSLKEVQQKKYFEASKDEIWEIIVKRRRILRPGFLMIMLRERRPFKITFGYSRNIEERFYQLMQLIELFCMKPPEIRPPNEFAWTL